MRAESLQPSASLRSSSWARRVVTKTSGAAVAQSRNFANDVIFDVGLLNDFYFSGGEEVALLRVDGCA